MRIRNAQFNLTNMKNLITYFTPRNAEERNTLGGIFVGVFIIISIITLNFI